MPTSYQLLINGTAQILSGVLDPTWGAATTTTVAQVSRPLTDAEADALTVLLHEYANPSTVQTMAVFVDIDYVVAGTVDVTGPSSVPVLTSVPTVTWTATLDPAGGPQVGSVVRVFSAAQYSAFGFDPAVSAATSAVASGNVSSLTLLTALTDGTYRAYVRVSQIVNGTLMWTPWDFIAFTVSTTPPPPPTFDAVTVEHANARVIIDMAHSGVGVAANYLEVERSIDGGVTWQWVRSPDGFVSPTSPLTYDYEVGNGVDVLYRARAVKTNTNQEIQTSGWVLASATVVWHHLWWWLKSPTHPALNMRVQIDSLPAISRPARQTHMQPLGRTSPVIVSDARGADSGTVRLYCADQDERDSLLALLDLCEPLLLQGVPGHHWRDRYLVFGDHEETRIADKAFVQGTFHTLGWTEVDTPTGDIVAWPT